MNWYLKTTICVSIGLVITGSLLTAAMLLYVRSQGMLVMSVQTGSMRPQISPGDAILVRQGVKMVRAGQIITYHSSKQTGLLITHRVIATDVSRGVVTTKGDALTDPDPAVPIYQIVGVAERTLPLLGYVLTFLRHPAGLIVVIYIPALTVIAAEIHRLVVTYTDQRYELYYC